MLCDPLQKSALSCPDTFCPSSNITFAVCEYTIAKDANNQTAFSYTECPDTSNLYCDSFKSCALLNIYVMQHGLNQTNTVNNGAKYVARCVSSTSAGNATIGSSGASSSSRAPAGSGNSAAASSIGNTHQAICTSILVLICLLTISMTKRLF